jgi:hypothetical protein
MRLEVGSRERRTADRTQEAIATTTRDTSPVSVRSRIATDGQHVVTVHRGSDDAAHLTVLDRDLTVLATAIVPGSEVFPAETVAGPLAIAANADGTFAVLSTERIAGSSSRGAVMRFRVCE